MSHYKRFIRHVCRISVDQYSKNNNNNNNNDAMSIKVRNTTMSQLACLPSLSFHRVHLLEPGLQ